MHSAWVGEHHFSTLGVCRARPLAGSRAKTSASGSRRRDRAAVAPSDPGRRAWRRSISFPTAASISPAGGL